MKNTSILHQRLEISAPEWKILPFLNASLLFDSFTSKKDLLTFTTNFFEEFDFCFDYQNSHLVTKKYQNSHLVTENSQNRLLSNQIIQFNLTFWPKSLFTLYKLKFLNNELSKIIQKNPTRSQSYFSTVSRGLSMCGFPKALDMRFGKGLNCDMFEQIHGISLDKMAQIGVWHMN